MYTCVNCGQVRATHKGTASYCPNNSGKMYDEGGQLTDKQKYDEQIRDMGFVIPQYIPLGEIHHFKSGASSSGHKPPYECLTIELLRRAAQRMQKGLHYGKHNWKKGAKDKQFILDRLNHALEHLVKAMHEIDNDVPMTDDDLAAVVVNCMFAMEYQKQIKS